MFATGPSDMFQDSLCAILFLPMLPQKLKRKSGAALIRPQGVFDKIDPLLPSAEAGLLSRPDGADIIGLA